MMYLDHFSAFTVCREMKKIANRCSIGREFRISIQFQSNLWQSDKQILVIFSIVYGQE